MRLAVINDWHDTKSAVFWNKDGFLKMLAVLRDRDGWDIKFFKKYDRHLEWKHDYVDLDFSTDPVKSALDWEPDAFLGFSDFSRPYLDEIKDKGIPIALCYTGGRFEHYKDVPDIIFVESKSYVKWMEEMGLPVVQAFGTNTELFKPWSQPKLFDAFFPGTFAGWKRFELFADAMGDKGLTCGWWQSNEPEIKDYLFEKGVAVLHHQLPESIVQLYNMSHTVVVTSKDIGGSQRTVLEALACNIPVIVMEDSTMTSEYVRECGIGEIIPPAKEQIILAVERQKKATGINSRDWVMENYSEFVYADKVKVGIESII